MGRIHLFEFEDQAWFPKLLRDFGTDFLQFLSNKTKMYKPIVPVLQEALIRADDQMVDLGSGGGGGLIWLNQELKKERPNLKITLTDLFPNQSAFLHTSTLADNFEFIQDPIDARDVPSKYTGLRTQFLSFHHFRVSDAQMILQNAVDSKSPIAIFEAQERSIPSVIAMLFSPITVLLTTPMIRPFKWTRLLFTYLIPIVPLFVLWDGVVSALRTYSVSEMEALIQELENTDQFDWEVKRVKSGPGVILYLVGLPK